MATVSLRAGLLAQVRLAVRLSVRRKARLQEAAARDLREVRAAGYAFLSAYGTLLLWPALVGCALYLLLQSIDTDALLKLAASGGAAAWALVVGANRLVTKDLVDWFKRLATPAGGLLVLPDYSDKLGSFHDINRTLDDLCALTLDAPAGKDSDKYLLVIVDDLDRCAPATVKQVFDAVRLVASIPRVVVLVALDERIAFSAVEKHYAEYGHTGREPSQDRHLHRDGEGVRPHQPPRAVAHAAKLVAPEGRRPCAGGQRRGTQGMLPTTAGPRAATAHPCRR